MIWKNKCQNKHNKMSTQFHDFWGFSHEFSNYESPREELLTDDLVFPRGCASSRQVDDAGELAYSLDDGHTRFSDLIQLVEFYQLNRGVLPCKLKQHCSGTTL